MFCEQYPKEGAAAYLALLTARPWAQLPDGSRQRVLVYRLRAETEFLGDAQNAVARPEAYLGLLHVFGCDTRHAGKALVGCREPPHVLWAVLAELEGASRAAVLLSSSRAFAFPHFF